MRVLVVGRNSLNQGSEYVLIAPLIERSRVPHTDLPSHVMLTGVDDELDGEWVILCELLRSLKERLCWV